MASKDGGYRNDKVLDHPLLNSHVVGSSNAPVRVVMSTGTQDETAVAVPVAFDPGEHTVAEVTEYLDQHPDSTADVVAAEKAGKGRSTITALTD